MTLKCRALPDKRRGSLKYLLNQSCGVKVIEAHNGLSAIVSSSVCCEDNVDKKVIEFDGLWVSSLTSSASRGLPDTELSGIERRLETIQETLNASAKLLIVDGDTGGDTANLEYLCCRLESMGVSAIVIEDQQYPKRNSLSKEAMHRLEDPEIFANKILRAKKVLISDDFMVFARLESLIAGQGMEDALARTRTYLLAGADGIVIHSKKKTPDEVYSFLERYEALSAELGFRKPIICIPTTYNSVTDDELFQHGVNIVIHANHLLRAAHRAMQMVCKTILQNGRSLEAESLCTSVSNLFEVVGFNDIVARDSQLISPGSHRPFLKNESRE